MVGFVATGMVPLFIETTVPAIDGVPPAQVVDRLAGDAIVALPPIVEMSSEKAVMFAALAVSVFSSVTVTVETWPSATEDGVNVLLTSSVASATPAVNPAIATAAAAARRMRPITLCPIRRSGRCNCSA